MSKLRRQIVALDRASRELRTPIVVDWRRQPDGVEVYRVGHCTAYLREMPGGRYWWTVEREGMRGVVAQASTPLPFGDARDRAEHACNLCFYGAP